MFSAWRIASMVYKLLDKKTSGSAATLAQSETLATRNKFAVKNESMSNKEFAKELHKPIISKFETPFVDNLWYADLAIMQLITKCNKGIHFLLCVIVIFSKYAWVIPLKGKKDTAVTNTFQKILDESNHKPNKI